MNLHHDQACVHVYHYNRAVQKSIVFTILLYLVVLVIPLNLLHNLLNGLKFLFWKNNG